MYGMKELKSSGYRVLIKPENLYGNVWRYAIGIDEKSDFWTKIAEQIRPELENKKNLLYSNRCGFEDSYITTSLSEIKNIIIRKFDNKSVAIVYTSNIDTVLSEIQKDINENIRFINSLRLNDFMRNASSSEDDYAYNLFKTSKITPWHFSLEDLINEPFNKLPSSMKKVVDADNISDLLNGLI